MPIIALELDGSSVAPVKQGSLRRQLTTTLEYIGGETTELSGDASVQFVLSDEAEALGSLEYENGQDVPSVLNWSEVEANTFYFNPDGPKDHEAAINPVDAWIAMERADGYPIRVDTSHFRIGGYDYEVAFAADSVAHGDSVSVSVQPVYGDGDLVVVPDDVLLHRMTIDYGRRVDITPPPAKQELAEKTAMPSESWRTQPTSFVPLSECPSWSQPIDQPGRFYVPNSWNGQSLGSVVQQGCDEYGQWTLVNVPQNLASSGQIMFVADTVAPEPEQVIETGVLAYMSDIQGDSSFGSSDVVIEPFIEVRFLRQDDSLIPTEQEDRDNAVLMVSKFVTDDRLDASTPFFSAYSNVVEDGTQSAAADAGDKFTFRPQVTGIEAGKSVKFEVSVVRSGSITYQHVFSSAGDTLDVDTPQERYAYRGTQHLRLVSNGRPTPSNTPSGAKYDDEYRGEQTIRVELEDIIRVMVTADGKSVSTAQLPVGRPASEAGPYAVRRAELSWKVLESLVVNAPSGNPIAPDSVTRRMSEDWAQAGVYFEKAGEDTFSTLEGVLVLQAKRACGLLGLGMCKAAPEPGILQFEAQLGASGFQPIAVPYSTGDLIVQIAAKVQAELIATFGLETIGDILTSQSHDRERRYFVFAAPHVVMRFDNTASSKAFELTIGDTGFLSQIESPYELNMIARGVNDSDPQTIDIIVLPSGAFYASTSGLVGDVRGRAFGDGDGSSLQYAVNTFFVDQLGADLEDDYPFVAGHEAGHVLFDGEAPGTHPVRPDGTPDLAHITDVQNLMAPLSVVVEAYDAPKRLTYDMQLDARADSGPGSNGPVLLQAKGKGE